MIFFILPIIAVTTGIIVFSVNKIQQKEKKICVSLIIINIVIIAIFRFVVPVASKYSEIIIPFWINIVVNIVLILILFNDKIRINIKSVILIIIIYFLCMIFIPTYKLENHEHTFINGRESIHEYIDYYNYYGIRIKRNYK